MCHVLDLFIVLASPVLLAISLFHPTLKAQKVSIEDWH